MSPKRRDSTDEAAPAASAAGSRAHGRDENRRTAPSATRRHTQQAAVKKNVDSFVESLAELAAELDLGGPTAQCQDGDPAPAPSAWAARLNQAAEPDPPHAPEDDHQVTPAPLPPDVPEQRSVPEFVTPPLPTTAPAPAGGRAAPPATARTTETRTAKGLPEFGPRAWDPGRAMAPLAPLYPPPQRPITGPSPLAEDETPTPVPRQLPLRLALIAAVIVVTVAIAGVAFGFARRPAPLGPAAGPPTSTGTPAPTPTPARPTGADLTVHEVRLVQPSSGNPFTAPALTTAATSPSSLLLVVRYEQNGGDGKVEIALARTGSPTSQPMQSVLNRTYLLSGSGADVIYLMPPTGTFGPGHYILDVAHSGRPSASLTFEIRPGTAAGL